MVIVFSSLFLVARLKTWDTLMGSEVSLMSAVGSTSVLSLEEDRFHPPLFQNFHLVRNDLLALLSHLRITHFGPFLE